MSFKLIRMVQNFSKLNIIVFSPPHLIWKNFFYKIFLILIRKKCCKVECAVKCVQAVGSSLFFGLFCHFFFLFFFSVISCLPSLKWVMHDWSNYPCPHPHSYIATLGSILDSQLSWKSSKFQLARWSHKVAWFSEGTTHPPTHHPPEA